MPAGVCPVSSPGKFTDPRRGVEDVNVSGFVKGHFDYQTGALGSILTDIHFDQAI